MGLGFVNKRLRNDRLFGASYFVFRILFDFALMHEYVCGRPSMKTTTKMMVVYKSLLHVKFFYDWINQQSRLRKRMALAASVQPPRLDVKEASNSESSALRLSDTAQQDKKPMAVFEAEDHGQGIREARAEWRNLHKHDGNNVVCPGDDDGFAAPNGGHASLENRDHKPNNKSRSCCSEPHHHSIIYNIQIYLPSLKGGNHLIIFELLKKLLRSSGSPFIVLLLEATCYFLQPLAMCSVECGSGGDRTPSLSNVS